MSSPSIMSCMFGPNRVAADIEGNGEFEFIGRFIRVFGQFLEEFWRN